MDRHYASTIIELLVVVTIVAILIGLMLPAVGRWIRAAQITIGLSNTIVITEDAGRPHPFSRRSQGPSVSNPDARSFSVMRGRVRRAGWADELSAIPLHGFTPDGLTADGLTADGLTADGLTAPGPYAINRSNNNETFSFHREGVSGVFADGSVRFIDESIEIGVYAAIVARAGSEDTRTQL